MPTIKVVNYSYNCPYCLKTKKSNDHIPMCKVCGEFVCSKCSDKAVCPGCISKLNLELKKIFDKKGKKDKVLTSIFRQVYGSNFLIKNDREGNMELKKALGLKMLSKEDASEEFLKFREINVKDTHNSELWK
ncbi:MAG: hypothetical protein JXA99_07980 [Candidatus Lokiarchaeota archaeon]|nr:hypothetical protein [Candidatus Lokiarchaeota archaeon]